MNPHLQLVNGVIGLALGAPPWPRLLGDLGYDLYWVGPRFTLANGLTMNPDLVLMCAKRNHCLVVEAKSGTSLKSSQLVAASQLTVTDLQRGAYVSFRATDLASFSYAIFGLENGAEEIALRLDAAAHAFPVIQFAHDSVRLVRGAVNDPILAAKLASGVSLTSAPFPRQFIPFDSTSTLAEIAAVVIAAVVKEAVKGRPHFQLEEILRNEMPLWPSIHPKERNQILGGALRVVDRLRKTTDFKYIIRPAGAPDAQHLYTVSMRVPGKNGGERLVRPETLRNWAASFMRDLQSESLPPSLPKPDEGTQSLAPLTGNKEG